jgi:hypothetical protein
MIARSDKFPADRIMTSILLYIWSLVNDLIKIEVNDWVCICALSTGNFDNP